MVEVCDEFGAGLRPRECKKGVVIYRDCCTPLTVYQSTHGEYAKKVLTGEICRKRNIIKPPPCGVCEDVLPLCRGYYRYHKYADNNGCEKTDENIEETANNKKSQGGNFPIKSKVESYWNQQCAGIKHHSSYDERRVGALAAHNSGLAERLNLGKSTSRKCRRLRLEKRVLEEAD